MSLSRRSGPRMWGRVCWGALSAALHLMLVLALLSGQRQDGVDTDDVPRSKLVLLEAPQVNRTSGVELPPIEPATPRPVSERSWVDAIPPPILVQSEATGPSPSTPEPAIRPVSIEPSAIHMAEMPRMLPISSAEQAALARHLERLAGRTLEASPTEVTWQEGGSTYSAVLIRERAQDGTSLERVVAELSAANRGKQLKTRIRLKRLAFSQFTQMVDEWDPMVQLHDDEIVGRFHSNSAFNLMYDSHAAPRFLGKVTTAARSYTADWDGRRRDSDVFQGGVETRADRIPLPVSSHPFKWAPTEEGARVHELATDTHIRFFADGSYAWRGRTPQGSGYLNDPTESSIYFIATPGTTLYVQGVVAGKVLVYSPQRIVIEGNLTYARDPRADSDSRDYLGLVCDRNIEVASPGVTGPGDLQIDAAILAGRRFLVTNIDHGRAATLRIYGSLSAGSLSATEPRYATRIDYDSRFERQRPPGFPSTNRYEIDEWDARWTEVSSETANDAY